MSPSQAGKRRCGHWHGHWYWYWVLRPGELLRPGALSGDREGERGSAGIVDMAGIGGHWQASRDSLASNTRVPLIRAAGTKSDPKLAQS